MRLPGCFLCYTPAHDAPPVAPLPALTNGFVTFGSFTALAKQTPEVRGGHLLPLLLGGDARSGCADAEDTAQVAARGPALQTQGSNSWFI